MTSRQHTEIKILIADDHKLIRSGVRALIEKESAFTVIGEAWDGRKAVELARELQPDVVIMDIAMPKQNGIEAIEEILCLKSPPKVIALSMHIEQKIVSGALHAGASGYLIKDCAQAELIEAIYKVWKGFTYLSPQITGAIVQDYTGKTSVSQGPAAELSAREREVLQLFVEGFSTWKIAEQLNISRKTVESHKANIMEKLGTRNLVEMVKYALKERLIVLDDWLASP